MIKKFILFLLIITNVAQAGFYDSDYFEPTAGCVAAGVGGYLADQDGDNPMLTGGLACLGVGIITYGVMQMAKKRVYSKNLTKIEELEIKNAKYEKELVNHAIKGDMTINYGIISEEEVPGANLNGRGVMSPTKIFKISK